ncbi:hypothetical protein KI659_15780 [Litoribacter alkaliphilus]|uniref:Uncharacterized protein n=1 Tax=Litoribacter ruber TaxID=702568 RepID=A0AAP2CLK1_9BACT|nr:hypothetical protein [Litoribacter alkaliphilus]MBS9525476.1 hypothetical protein [Litoribacter alkaliphilus]
MTEIISKESLMLALEGMPENFFIEELVDRLMLINKIEKGLKDSDAENTYTAEEAKAKLSKWLK